MPSAVVPSHFDPRAISRPDPALFSYYLIISLLSNIAFPFVFLPLLFKYKTLHYKFDDEGVSMSWGILFRRETYLTYRRVQDIHVTRNILQRWLGLASIAIQTASGTSGAEMTVEGVLEYDALRDYLYAKMRGAKGEPAERAASAAGDASGDPSSSSAADRRASTTDTDDTDAHRNEALALLHEIRDELRRLNSRGGGR